MSERTMRGFREQSRPWSPRRPLYALLPGDPSRSCDPHLMMKLPAKSKAISSISMTTVEPEILMQRHSPRMLHPLILVLTGLMMGAESDSALDKALEGINPEQVLAHIKVLASDEFEGRGPGTAGEQK